MRIALTSFLCTALALATAGCGSTTSSLASRWDSFHASPAIAGTYYNAYTQSYEIPWSNSPNFDNLTSTLKVHAQVNGGTTSSYTVDTGSVGFIVPASEVPNIPANSPAGHITYFFFRSPSGWRLATLPVTFPDSTDQTGTAAVATSTIPVLAVSTGTCTGTGVNSGSCTGTIPHMMGIGFGRGTTVQTSPVYNVALNLSQMTAGTMRRGYLIKRGGLYVGLTPTDVGNSFTTQTLTSQALPRPVPTMTGRRPRAASSSAPELPSRPELSCSIQACST